MRTASSGSARIAAALRAGPAPDGAQHDRCRDHRPRRRCVGRTFNWFTLHYRYQTVDTYFGTSFHRIELSGARPLVTSRRADLKNDHVHQVVDIHHV
ncbi:hypothetical protein OG509_01605 [Streptomyces sp. NBC_01006]|nr:hypothetical protein OG509_01605 [Streptomyces sp. NBC_01006]